MKKKILQVALLLIIGAVSVPEASAQDFEPPMSERRERPAEMSVDAMTYRTADDMRNEFSLDNKQFEKVSKAYKDYYKKLFPETTSSQRPMGPPPGGPGGRGGFGGPGGGPGMPLGGSENMNSRRPEDMEEQMEQRRKDVAKAEEKLSKKMKKILSEDDFIRWQQWQAERMRPKEPKRPM